MFTLLLLFRALGFSWDEGEGGGGGRRRRRRKGKWTERGEEKLSLSLFPAAFIVSNLPSPNPLGRLDSEPGYYVTFLVRDVQNFVQVLEALVSYWKSSLCLLTFRH